MATESDVTSVPYSGLIHVDALIDHSPAWNYLSSGQGNVLSYTFSVAAGLESTLYGASTPGFTAFNSQQADAARNAIAYTSTITGIQFVEISDGSAADLHFANYDIAGNASGIAKTYASWSIDFSGTLTSYDAVAYVYLDNNEGATNNAAPSPGNQGYQTLLHEIGHALGLKHPFEAPWILPAGEDNSSNTIMSYTPQGGPYATFQPFDLAAFDWLYGADGLGGLGLGPGSTGIKLTGADADETLLGSNGNDELYGANGNDILLGAAGDDSILGGEGNDYLHGNEGFDTLRGGMGNDELRGGKNGDFIYSGQDNDLVFGALGHDELRGGMGNDTIYAGQGNDTLYGGANDDLLQGRLGNDLLTGGSGADVFWFNGAGSDTADTITDFTPGQDEIELDSSAFLSLAGMAGGSPAAGNFLAGAGAVAQNTNQLILYDTSTGDLYYDPDGSGAAQALLIATLSNAPSLAAGDIMVS